MRVIMMIFAVAFLAISFKAHAKIDDEVNGVSIDPNSMIESNAHAVTQTLKTNEASHIASLDNELSLASV